jgi:hypothetical protein
MARALRFPHVGEARRFSAEQKCQVNEKGTARRPFF